MNSHRPAEMKPTNTIITQHCRLRALTAAIACCSLLLALTPLAACGLTTNSMGLVQYQSFDAQAYTLKPWIGTNIAMLTPTNCVLNTNVMSNVVSALDKAYAFYRQATGRQPSAWDPTTLYGRDVIAVVSNSCGAGCAYLGFNGIEILTPYFMVLYNGVATNNQYDQVLFYELGRNFWFYSSQLAYFSPDNDPVVTGYAVYMRFAAMDAAGVEGGPFNGHSYAVFRNTVTNLMDSYMGNPSLNWSNTFRLSQAPPNPLGLGGTDLIASLLMRIGRDFGPPDFALKFWRQAALRPAVTTTGAAVDNFILAACATVNQNLTHIFTNHWKFPMSLGAMQEAQTRWGAPVEYRPSLAFAMAASSNNLISWQTQTNTTYQLQVSTNLQAWTNIGSSIVGDASI